MNGNSESVVSEVEAVVGVPSGKLRVLGAICVCASVIDSAFCPANSTVPSFAKNETVAVEARSYMKVLVVSASPMTLAGELTARTPCGST